MSKAKEHLSGENIALYIVYAAAAYFGMQYIFKPKAGSQSSIILTPEEDELKPTNTASDNSNYNKTASTPAPKVVAKSTLYLTEQFPIRKGMKGAKTAAVQQKFKLKPDGIFGVLTENALFKNYGVRTINETLFNRITNPIAASVNTVLQQLKAKTGTGVLLQQGSKGNEVYRLQKWLGFKDKAQAKKGEPIADGIMGAITVQYLLKKTGKRQINSRDF